MPRPGRYGRYLRGASGGGDGQTGVDSAGDLARLAVAPGAGGQYLVPVRTPVPPDDPAAVERRDGARRGGAERTFRLKQDDIAFAQPSCSRCLFDRAIQTSGDSAS